MQAARHLAGVGKRTIFTHSGEWIHGPGGSLAAGRSGKGLFMVLDGQTALTCCFNFTKAAESINAENLLVLRSKELAAEYIKTW